MIVVALDCVRGGWLGRVSARPAFSVRFSRRSGGLGVIPIDYLGQAGEAAGSTLGAAAQRWSRPLRETEEDGAGTGAAFDSGRGGLSSRRASSNSIRREIAVEREARSARRSMLIL